MNNIHPIFDKIASREQKEQQLRQRGLTLWFTGLSGSGKSTVAIALESLLTERGYLCRILDGDNIRCGINSDLGFSSADRTENIRRIAHICNLFNQTGIVTLACFVSPTNELRELARQIIGNNDFELIYISTPLTECNRRDVKGLYAKAQRGEIADFTGITAPFEEPVDADITIDTTLRSVESCAEEIFLQIIKRIKYGKL